MAFLVLPLKMIAFQSLLLLMAIAIEASVLRQQLKLTPKQSVHYATSINFLSTFVGWVLFLNLQSITPQNVRLLLINCIFFDAWKREAILGVVLVALITFFVSFFVKLVGLIQLRLFLGDQPREEQPQGPRKFGRMRNPRQSAVSQHGNAVLVANALSYSAVTLVILIRLVAQNSVRLSLQ